MKKALLLVIISLIVLSTCVSVTAASTFYITVETSKRSYQVGEEVYVYGNLIDNGSANMCLAKRLVAIGVKDPDNDTILVVARQTDAEGAYNLTFRLSSTAKLGIYTIYVASRLIEEIATNRTVFECMLFLGDLNGDGKVDIRDIAIAVLAFGSYPGHPRWNPVADVNKDDKVDTRDIALIVNNFGRRYP